MMPAIESIEVNGDRIALPWSRLERVEWIASGPDFKGPGGAVGLRIVGAGSTIRVYRHVRRFAEIARIVLQNARSRGIPIDLPDGVAERLLPDGEAAGRRA